MRTMRVKRRFYGLLQSGKKILEVRVGYDSTNRIQVGERIRLVIHTEIFENESFEVKVSNIRRYKTFKEMINMETWERIAHDPRPRNEVLALFQQIYPADKEKLGVVVFEFTRIGK